ncbi:MAG: TlpA disulfide reductase family protein [Pirellulales bacterium]
MLFKLSSGWLVALLMAVVAVWAFLPAPLPAEDEDQPVVEEAADEAEDEEGQEADEADPAEELEEAEEADEVDPLALPEDTSPESLAKFIERVQTLRPDVKTQEELIEYVKKLNKVILEAADKIIEAKADEDLDTQAVRAKLAALGTLSQLDGEGAKKQLADYLSKLKDDKRPDIVKEAQLYLLANRYHALDHENAKQIKQFINDVRTQLGAGKFDPRLAQFAMEAARLSQSIGDTQFAIETNRQFAELFAKSGNPQIEQAGQRFEANIRKLEMVGKPLDIEGSLVDGSQFDWSAYQGKVVLVDFWATWCGPCIQELPNVKETYEKYRDKGFDVVGISLDEDREAVEEFLKEEEIGWTTLFGTSPESGWNHPMAQRYGVDGIPMAVLVDRDGNVVSISARGEALGTLVAELVEKKPSASPATKAAAGKQDKKPAAKKPSASSGTDTPVAKKTPAKKPAAKKPAVK